ncbi:unnamed protein product, partial [Closterium sp. NIES-53]
MAGGSAATATTSAGLDRARGAQWGASRPAVSRPTVASDSAAICASGGDDGHGHGRGDNVGAVRREEGREGGKGKAQWRVEAPQKGREGPEEQQAEEDEDMGGAHGGTEDGGDGGDAGDGADGGELRKGQWTAEEDELLLKCIQQYGDGNWSSIPKRAGQAGLRITRPFFSP